MEPEIDTDDSQGYYDTLDRLQWEAWNEANAEHAAERERAAAVQDPTPAEAWDEIPF